LVDKALLPWAWCPTRSEGMLSKVRLTIVG
jgi:hypothetical protein